MIVVECSGIDHIYAQCEQESFIPQCQEVISTLEAAVVDFRKLILRLEVQEPVQRQLEVSMRVFLVLARCLCLDHKFYCRVFFNISRGWWSGPQCG